MSNPIRLRYIILAGCVVLFLLASGISITAIRHHTKEVAHSTTAQKSSKAIPQLSTSNSIANNKISNLQQSKSADTPITEACKLLTRAIAQQLVGSDAGPSTPSDISSLQTTDTMTTACAYSGDAGTIQLAVRTPTNSTGASENDTMFGSARPRDAITVSDYGQPTYWDPSRGTLNALGSNSWYIITREPSSQAHTEAATKLIQSGF